MFQRGWYLLAYDISDPKRLQRVHRFLKNQGLAVQKSLFFIQGSPDKVKALMGRLQAIIKADCDDVRAYPVAHPGRVWLVGNEGVVYPLVTTATGASSQRGLKVTPQTWWQRLFS